MKGRIAHVVKTVTTAGTAERLMPNNKVVSAVNIQALGDNTNNIYIGDSSVSSTSFGIELDALDTVTISAETLGMANVKINLADIWIDVDTGTEGVAALWLERD